MCFLFVLRVTGVAGSSAVNDLFISFFCKLHYTK